MIDKWTKYLIWFCMVVWSGIAFIVFAGFITGGIFHMNIDTLVRALGATTGALWLLLVEYTISVSRKPKSIK